MTVQIGHDSQAQPDGKFYELKVEAFRVADDKRQEYRVRVREILKRGSPAVEAKAIIKEISAMILVSWILLSSGCGVSRRLSRDKVRDKIQELGVNT